jgi:uncharacterized membrane protein (UPF0127 family)
MLIEIKDGKRKLKIKVKKLSSLGKFIGLMFASRRNESLLFEFSGNLREPIHSLFVFFPFLAIWLDKDNRVLERRIVRPFFLSVRPRRAFKKLVEIPINRENRKILQFFVGKGKI